VLQGDGTGNKAPSCLQVRPEKCMCESVGGRKNREKETQFRDALIPGLSLHGRFHFLQWHPNQLGR